VNAAFEQSEGKMPRKPPCRDKSARFCSIPTCFLMRPKPTLRWPGWASSPPARSGSAPVRRAEIELGAYTPR